MPIGRSAAFRIRNGGTAYRRSALRGLGANDVSRRDLYRDLFRTALDDAPLAALRMALNQDQPI